MAKARQTENHEQRSHLRRVDGKRILLGDDEHLVRQRARARPSTAGVPRPRPLRQKNYRSPAAVSALVIPPTSKSSSARRGNGPPTSQRKRLPPRRNPQAGVERFRLLFCVGRPPVAETPVSRSLLPLVAKQETRLPPERRQ